MNELTHQGAKPILSLVGIKKTCPNGTVALKGVDFQAYAGSVHGLLSANGAGKSTLIKILSATYPASEGTQIWRGQQVAFVSPLEANKAGIATIHQNIPLVPMLSVLENIFLWKEKGWRNDPKDRAKYAEICDEVGYYINPDDLVSDLSIGVRQMRNFSSWMSPLRGFMWAPRPTFWPWCANWPPRAWP